MKFENPYKKKKVTFKEKKVEGFCGDTEKQKKQVKVYEYKDRDNFTVSLKTKAKNDEIFLLKYEENLEVGEVLEMVGKL